MKNSLTERQKWLMGQVWEAAFLYQRTCKPMPFFATWLKENEARLAEEAPTVDCKQCANRGQLNGTSQELVCDSCIHYGSNWRKDMFVQKNNGE